jgi:tetratricopeptide (TPR) repeat protein
MRTTLSTLALCIAAFAFAQPASAATIVVGVNSYAHSCYNAAVAGDAAQIAICNQALSEVLTPRDRAATLINRSALKIEVGDYQGGLADCENSIRHFNTLGEAYLNRGVALRALGRNQEAIEALNQSIEVGLLRPQLAYYDRAMAEEDIGKIADAYHDYKTALELAPNFSLAAEQVKRFKITQVPDSQA